MNPGPQPALHPLRASAAEFAPAPSLEVVACQRLLNLAVGLACLHVVIGFGHLLNPAGWNLHSALDIFQETPWSRLPAFVLAIASAFFLFVLRLLLPRLPLRWSHPLGAFVATLVVINALGWFTLGATPEKSVPLAFAVFGAGCLLFTTRSLVLVISIALGGWCWFAREAGFAAGWIYFGGVLVAACLIAILFQRLHLQTIKQMLRTTVTPDPTKAGAEDADSAAVHSEAHFRQWCEATFEGIAIHERGIILEANQALATLLRSEVAALVGQNVMDWFTRASRSVMEESILLGNFRPFEAVARRSDKSELHLELYTKRMTYGGKEVMVTAFRDITERQRAAAALNAEQQRLQLQYRRQVALAHLAVNIGESTEVTRILDCIAETASTVLPTTGGACVLAHEEGQFELAASHIPRAAELRFEPVAQFARVADWIRENRETFVASNITRDDPFEVNRPVPFVTAYIGVPLFDADRLLGILFVIESEEPRHFMPDELDFINELAGRAAMAIAKARLYAKLSEANRRLEKQSALLLMQNEDLARAKTEAEAVSDAKSEFLAKISHELRTPMNGVIGMTDYLLTTDLSTDQRESADAVRASAERLLSQIDRILDFSHLEAGFFAPTHIALDVREMAADLMAQAESCRGDKPIAFQALIDSGVPKQLKGDAAALRRALWSLLDNAIRFTDQGEVSLEMSCEPTSKSNVTLKCAVRDTGRGMSAETRALVFDPFAQADNSLARQHEGLGLGLATTKRLIERLHGGITVESAPGRGSVFTVSIPLEIATPVVASATAS